MTTAASPTAANARFWLGFALLAAWEFGWLAYGVVLLVSGRFGLAFVAAVLAVVGGHILPRPIAWLTMLGHHPDRTTPPGVSL